MHFGIFLGVGTVATLLALFIGIIVFGVLLYVTFLTPAGFVIIPLGLFLGFKVLCK